MRKHGQPRLQDQLASCGLGDRDNKFRVIVRREISPRDSEIFQAGMYCLVILEHLNG